MCVMHRNEHNYLTTRKDLTGNGQSSGTTANSISPDDYSQYWLAENASNGAVYLRNLNNGI